jgi:hypothetical protein
LTKGEKDLEYRAELYAPYQSDLTQLRSRSIDLAQIAARDAHAQQAIDAFLAERGGRRIISTCPCAAETRTS